MQVEFEAVVRPRAELEVARLLVKREVTYVDGARALVDGHRDPEDVADRGHDGHRLPMFLESRVCTETKINTDVIRRVIVSMGCRCDSSCVSEYGLHMRFVV